MTAQLAALVGGMVGFAVGYLLGYVGGRISAADLERHRCIRCRRDKR